MLLTIKFANMFNRGTLYSQISAILITKKIKRIRFKLKIISYL